MHEISTESYSPYKTVDQIPQYFEKDKNFCVMTLNCQSINAKFDKLKTMIKYLKENNFGFDNKISFVTNEIRLLHFVLLIMILVYNF